MKVKEVMKPVKGKRDAESDLNVNAEESIDNAAVLMKENGLEEIPVVDSNDKVIGKITRSSIIDACEDINEDFFLD